MPNALANIRGLFFLDGSDSFLLEAGANALQIFMIQVIITFVSDASIHVIGMDADLLQGTQVPNKIETIVAIVPKSICCKPINVFSLRDALLEFMHTCENIVNPQSMQVAWLDMFPAKMAP